MAGLACLRRGTDNVRGDTRIGRDSGAAANTNIGLRLPEQRRTKMPFPDRRTTDVRLTVAFFVLVCAIIYSARHILLVFVLAVFFAYLINPIVKNACIFATTTRTARISDWGRERQTEELAP
jgi:hypothetical protein